MAQYLWIGIIQISVVIGEESIPLHTVLSWFAATAPQVILFAAVLFYGHDIILVLNIHHYFSVTLLCDPVDQIRLLKYIFKRINLNCFNQKCYHRPLSNPDL